MTKADIIMEKIAISSDRLLQAIGTRASRMQEYANKNLHYPYADTFLKTRKQLRNISLLGFDKQNNIARRAFNDISQGGARFRSKYTHFGPSTHR